MTLSRAQYNGLLKPIDPARIAKDQKGHAHVEAWDVRRHLIRLFGFGGWDFTVVSCDLVAEWTHPPKDGNDKVRYSIVYRVIGRLTVRDPDGNVLCVYEDGATGDSMNQPSFGDAHDMALKTAMSQAIKRCAANLGDQFGLGLYNDGKPAAVVLGSYVAPPPEAEPKEARGERTGDTDGSGAEPGPPGPGPGPDGERAGERRPGGDPQAGGVRPGVQPGVHRQPGVGGSAQAPGGRRDTPAPVGGRRE